MSRTICVVTGSRADYGLLYWVLRDLRDATDLELRLIVTGMHLSDAFGETVREIERDGFTIAARVEAIPATDDDVGVAKAIGYGIVGATDALVQVRPDVVLVLGDRYEIFAFAQACLALRIPLAHIAGGDTTEGAIDEAIRHSITKMAQVHFVTNEVSARRVRQLGEDPERVHVVGSPGLDHLRRSVLLDRAALERSLGAPLGKINLLVTYHPVSLDADDGLAGYRELLAALGDLDDGIICWCTKPNADASGRAFADALDAWAADSPTRRRVFQSLGQQRYLSMLAQADAVVGNSSSGLYEAPSFGVPTVDVGERQRGRLAADSVIWCAAERTAISGAVRAALVRGKRSTENPYGDGRSAGRILDVLRALPPAEKLLRKRFHLLECTE